MKEVINVCLKHTRKKVSKNLRNFKQFKQRELLIK